jgi:hypothetical protein
MIRQTKSKIGELAAIWLRGSLEEGERWPNSNVFRQSEMEKIMDCGKETCGKI